MAAPTTLAVGVDREEYSRFESDHSVVTVSVLPGVPTTDLAAPVLAGANTMTVENATVLPLAPFDVRVGPAGAQETVTVTLVVGNVLTIAGVFAAPHAVCAPVALFVDLSGELFALQLIKARRNRDVVVATIQMSYADVNPAVATGQFDLANILDSNAAPRVRRGSYFVRAISVTDPAVYADSPDFLVSLITVERFKQEWLHGADRQAHETEVVKNQPVLITGVSIPFVSRNHQRGWFALSYNVSDPGGCGTPVRLLSWCDGPVVAIERGRTKYTLRKGKSQTDYIDVTVLSVDALPRASVAEELMIDREPLKDEFFRARIEASINWVERTALMAFVEPTRVVTEIDANAITYAPGSDVPIFVQSDWDARVDALTYTAPAAGRWINFRMPYFPTITFFSLYGKISNVRIVDIALEWIEVDEIGGFVELVPFNQETAFNFIGLVWVESLRGPRPLPNFWNFDALVGFRETPPIILELIAKKAAIDALTQIGQAFRVGIGSQSVSRDGVSESVSYLTSGQYGIFSATIKTYSEWIDKNLPMLRGSFKGVNMVVV